MPKLTKETAQTFNIRMVQTYPNVLDIESSLLFCKLCRCYIYGTKLFSVHQHFRTLKHKNAEISSEEKPSVSSFLQVKSELDSFNLDLCTTFLEANIPLETVNNSAVQMFFQKYMGKTLPRDTILRTECVPTLYERYLQNIRNKARSKGIWISITQSINSDNYLIANFVFGLIEENEIGNSYLLNMTRLERANASCLAVFLNHSLQILWPERILYENIYLVITEAIPYMKTAMQSLKILYPNMIHVYCLLEVLDKLVQIIRIHFNHVNTFIINCEAVFLKSPHHLHLLRSKYHYLSLPSFTASSTAPVRTWLQTAIYYCNNFTEIKTVLDILSEEEDSECVKQTKELIQNSAIEIDLVYLKENFGCILPAITKLENRNIMLNESLAMFNIVYTAVHATKRAEFITKFEQMLNENSGLKELITINKADNTFEHKIYKCVPIVIANIEHPPFVKTLLENDITQKLTPKTEV